MVDTINPVQLKFDRYSLVGVSTAGIGTCVTIPEYKVAFDVAQGLPFAFSMKYFLITHAHQDHAGGIPYLISQKALMSQAPPKIFLPPGTGAKLEKIVRLWSELEGYEYDLDLSELSFEKRLQLDGNLYVQPFRTLHRVVSQGYTLFLKNKKLKAEFAGMERQEILDLKSKGVEIDEPEYQSKVSFTGDTQIEFLDLSPEVVNSETLIMEVTYFDERKTIQAARQWGHIHYQEVLGRLPKIKSQNIVWIHRSARYSKEFVRQMIDRELPDHRQRIHVL